MGTLGDITRAEQAPRECAHGGCFGQGAENANSNWSRPGCWHVPHPRTRVVPTRQARSSRFDSSSFPPPRETLSRRPGLRKPRPPRGKNLAFARTPRLAIQSIQNFVPKRKEVVEAFSRKPPKLKGRPESADCDPRVAAPPPPPSRSVTRSGFGVKTRARGEIRGNAYPNRPVRIRNAVFKTRAFRATTTSTGWNYDTLSSSPRTRTSASRLPE